MSPINHSDAVDKLMQLGDCREFPGSFDYLSLGLTEADIPELIRIATDRDLLWAEGDEAQYWAPIHAWRALGYLHAEAAIEPLISLLNEGDKYDGIRDWLEDSMPDAFARIGPRAVPPLKAHMANSSQDERSRMLALSCLEQIGRKHRSARGEIVSAIVEQLKNFRINDPGYNGFLVSALIELDDSDALPLIEQAYGSGHVDEMVCGDFQDVREAFGLTPASGIFDAL